MRWGIAVALGVMTVTAACGRGDDGVAAPPPDLQRIEVASPPSPLVEPVVAVGDVLLALGASHEDANIDAPETLFRSADRGATWEAVVLPGAPAQIGFDAERPRLVGDVAVVSGRSLVDALDLQIAGGDVFVWTSRDGHTWQGGRLGPGGPAFSGAEVHAAGDVLVVGTMSGTLLPDTDVDQFGLRRSTDGGATWEPVEIPDLALQPGERVSLLDVSEEDGQLVATLSRSGSTQGVLVTGDEEPPPYEEPVQPILASTDGGATWQTAECPYEAPEDATDCRPLQPVGRLLVAGEQVSTDGGESWHDVAIEAEACPADATVEAACSGIRQVVEQGDDGWLGTAVGELDSATAYETLLHSTDGVHWEQVDPPAACPVDRDHVKDVGVLGPVALGEDWLVGYTCAGEPGDVSELFTLGSDHRHLLPLPDSRREGISYGTPIPTGGGILVPELIPDGNITAFLSLMPGAD